MELLFLVISIYPFCFGLQSETTNCIVQKRAIYVTLFFLLKILEFIKQLVCGAMKVKDGTLVNEYYIHI